VFNPLRSFNKIPGASVAIVNSDVDVGYRIYEKVFIYLFINSDEYDDQERNEK